LDDDSQGLFNKMLKYGKSVKFNYAKRKVFLRVDHSSALFTMSLALAVAVRKLFREKANIKFSQEPLIDKKPITSFMKRMRVDPMEKFNGPTVVSIIHFYKNLQDMDLNRPCGVLLTYIEIAAISGLLKRLDYPEIDDDEEEEVEDACGAICNVIAGGFKLELLNIGYPALEMSSFESHINSVVNGTTFPLKSAHKYEINYEMDGHKKLVTELVMAPLPRASAT
jgi:hypothetical protein